MKYALTILILAAGSANAADLHCHGTEPFWNAVVGEKTVFYRSPEKLDGETTKIKSRAGASGMPDDFVRVIKTKHTSLTILNGQCSDGMSDDEYPYHVVYDRGDAVLYGCCQ